jgi:hypothetical protein
MVLATAVKDENKEDDRNNDNLYNSKVENSGAIRLLVPLSRKCSASSWTGPGFGIKRRLHFPQPRGSGCAPLRVATGATATPSTKWVTTIRNGTKAKRE